MSNPDRLIRPCTVCRRVTSFKSLLLVEVEEAMAHHQMREGMLEKEETLLTPKDLVEEEAADMVAVVVEQGEAAHRQMAVVVEQEEKLKF